MKSTHTLGPPVHTLGGKGNFTLWDFPRGIESEGVLVEPKLVREMLRIPFVCEVFSSHLGLSCEMFSLGKLLVAAALFAPAAEAKERSNLSGMRKQSFQR